MDFTQELKAGLKVIGVPYNTEYGGKHHKLLLDVNGKTVKYTLPVSPSDHRAAKNALSEIRGILGVKKNEEPVVHHLNASRVITKGIGYVRITFKGRTIRMMFPNGAEQRINISFNSESKRLCLAPNAHGTRKLSPTNNSSGGLDSVVSHISIPISKFPGLRAAKVGGKPFAITYVGLGPCIELPQEWWTERAMPPTAPAPTVYAKQEQNSDAKAILGMLNELLLKDKDLHVRVSDDGRSVKMTRSVTIEEEI